ncbi:hypothetical protein GEV33_008739 [Tenebrio molitor]|uniref:Endonuclease/exonuclease/phosphatase domain-containing protein n=1 Tax=Tenebrio molitor TaxID=7067 RepID=A0A8J6HI59_TENMO|nr:hypothetical protein GEV33_008739 [Tenebrio molitor]
MSEGSRNRSFSQGRGEASQEDKKKRKRTGKGKTGRQEEEEEEEVFGTSKKTARSPEVEKKLGREMEKILEKLEEVKREITEEIKELRKENQDVKREIEQLREEFKNKEKKWEEEKNSMSERVAWLETKMENEERRRRKNNIVITGWRSEGSSKQQSREKVEKFIKENIGEAKVKDCYNINKDQILVQMEEWSGKEKVMKQKGKLRGNRATEKIFIDNDLTKKEREIQKKIRAIAREERRQGKDLKVGYMKITIEGVQMRWNEEKGRLEKRVDGQKKGKTEGKHKGEQEKQGTKGRKGAKVLYWNVAGLRKRGDEFWDYVRQFEVVGLVETWVEKQSWEKVETTLPKEYKWEGQWAKRERKRGRAAGGIITGVKLGIEEKQKEKGEEEGYMERNVHIDNEWCKIVTVYSKEMRKTTRRVENTMKMDREECMLLGGDFNGRIGERGARNWEEEKEDGRRKTKDKVENAEGKRLIEWIEENGWEVLNGNKRGDEEGEVTYVGSRGETVIDYAIVNEAAWERVKEFKVGERVDFDHLPLEITIEGSNQEEKEKGEMREEEKKEETGGSNIQGAGNREDGDRAKGSDRESDEEKGGDSKGSKRGRKEKWMVGQRM